MKKMISMAMALALALALSMSAFAADDTAADGPKDGATANKSSGTATITSNDGATFSTSNDDDGVAQDADVGGADINVWAKVVDSATKIYKVDLAWGAMKFQYDSGAGKWNTTNHTYDTATNNPMWTETNFLDGTNNQLTITNHSNNAVEASLAYAMDGSNKFNETNGVNNVIGHFFESNAKAVTASKVLTGTYTDTNGTASAAADAISKISLHTADQYNTVKEGASADTNVLAGPRVENVYFAFSGTPDVGKGKDLNTFKKVGTITVTVQPDAAMADTEYSFVS